MKCRARLAGVRFHPPLASTSSGGEPGGDTPLCLRGKCRLAGQRGPQVMGVQSGREKGFFIRSEWWDPCFSLSRGHEEGTGRGAPSGGAGASKQDKEGEVGENFLLPPDFITMNPKPWPGDSADTVMSLECGNRAAYDPQGLPRSRNSRCILGSPRLCDLRQVTMLLCSLLNIKQITWPPVSTDQWLMCSLPLAASPQTLWALTGPPGSCLLNALLSPYSRCLRSFFLPQEK